MSRNRLRFIRRVVYRLKRTYGLPVDIYSVTVGASDLETGEKDLTYNKISVRRAIVQPARYHRDFVYDLSFISANKDFTTGGFFDTGDRRIVLDAVDLPAGWEPNINMYVIFKNKRYDIKSYYEYEDAMGYVLVTRETKGQDLVRLETAISVLTLQQTAEVTG